MTSEVLSFKTIKWKFINDDIFLPKLYVVHTEKLIHILLVILLNFVKMLWSLWDDFYTFMIKIIYIPPSYAKLLYWELATFHPSTKQILHVFHDLSPNSLAERHGIWKKNTCLEHDKKMKRDSHVQIERERERDHTKEFSYIPSIYPHICISWSYCMTWFS